jgi:hypothetical protein
MQRPNSQFKTPTTPVPFAVPTALPKSGGQSEKKVLWCVLMENKPTYQPPRLEPQPQFVQTTGISFPIGNGLPEDFGLEMFEVSGDTQ